MDRVPEWAAPHVHTEGAVAVPLAGWRADHHAGAPLPLTRDRPPARITPDELFTFLIPVCMFNFPPSVHMVRKVDPPSVVKGIRGATLNFAHKVTPAAGHHTGRGGIETLWARQQATTPSCVSEWLNRRRHRQALLKFHFRNSVVACLTLDHPSEGCQCRRL